MIAGMRSRGDVVPPGGPARRDTGPVSRRVEERPMAATGDRTTGQLAGHGDDPSRATAWKTQPMARVAEALMDGRRRRAHRATAEEETHEQHGRPTMTVKRSKKGEVG